MPGQWLALQKKEEIRWVYIKGQNGPVCTCPWWSGPLKSWPMPGQWLAWPIWTVIKKQKKSKVTVESNGCLQCDLMNHVFTSFHNPESIQIKATAMETNWISITTVSKLIEPYIPI
ncbi:Uncharacterized protein Fot_20562 [Forsythia ovata]|uniref:Uncharacterized protein n=1 Tax=Forsythia ovata TaxID=205694 RepID=A0ABD1NY86_9LAMI